MQLFIFREQCDYINRSYRVSVYADDVQTAISDIKNIITVYILNYPAASLMMGSCVKAAYPVPAIYDDDGKRKTSFDVRTEEVVNFRDTTIAKGLIVNSFNTTPAENPDNHYHGRRLGTEHVYLSVFDNKGKEIDYLCLTKSELDVYHAQTNNVDKFELADWLHWSNIHKNEPKGSPYCCRIF